MLSNGDLLRNHVGTIFLEKKTMGMKSIDALKITTNITRSSRD